MRVLLCEDDRSLSRGVSAFLVKNNITVDSVYDGEAVFDYLKVYSYDAMILDVMMPKKDGIQVLKELRSSGNHVPVLILSAKSEIDDKLAGLENGANDYMTKPFDSRELLARLHVLTRKNASEPHNEIVVGNVTLNRATFTISTGRGSYQLVKKEYQLMETFMENPNKVISAETLLNRIWAQESEAWVNTVWTYISYLRRKLEAIHADIDIRNKRNLGYYLEVKK